MLLLVLLLVAAPLVPLLPQVVVVCSPGLNGLPLVLLKLLLLLLAATALHLQLPLLALGPLPLPVQRGLRTCPLGWWSSARRQQVSCSRLTGTKHSNKKPQQLQQLQHQDLSQLGFRSRRSCLRAEQLQAQQQQQLNMLVATQQQQQQQQVHQ
jgi:hypothetical protein